MLISIIIPVYNAENYLKQTVESILSQSYKNIEIILIDDGSTDNSLNIMRKLYENNSKIKIFHKENGGVSSARNLGIKNSTGDYISFLDSDDWLEKDFLEKCIMIIKEKKVDIVRTDAKKEFFGNFLKISTILENGLYLKKDLYNKIYTKLLSDENIDNAPFCSCCFTLYKSSIIKNLNIFFDEKAKRLEDLLFNIDILMNCNSLYYLKGYLGYNIRNIPASLTKEKYIENIFDYYYYAYKESKVKLKKNKIKNLDNQLANQLIFYLIISFSNEISPCNSKDILSKIKYLKKLVSIKEVETALITVNTSLIDKRKLLKLNLLKSKKIGLYYLLNILIKKAYIPIVRRIKGNK